MFTQKSSDPYARIIEKSEISKWDITVNNVTVEPTMETLYWCKIVRLPELTNKQHIIGYEALLSRTG